MIASNIMVSNVITLKGDDSMRIALGHLGGKRIRVLPVVDEAGHVEGVITSRTLLRGALPRYITNGELADVSFAPDLPSFSEHIEELSGKSVSECASKEFHSAPPDTSITELAALFVNAENPAEGILIIDSSGILLGIIAPWDIFKRALEIRVNS